MRRASIFINNSALTYDACDRALMHILWAQLMLHWQHHEHNKKKKKNSRQTKERHTDLQLPRNATWHCADYWFSPASYWSLMFSSSQSPAKLCHVSRRHTDNAAHWLLAINSHGSWISLNSHHHASIQQTSATASPDLQIKAVSRVVLPRLAPSGAFHCHHHYGCYAC